MEKSEEGVSGTKREQDLGRDLLEGAKRQAQGRDKGAIAEGQAEEVHNREHPLPLDQAQGEKLLDPGQLLGCQKRQRPLPQPPQLLQVQHQDLIPPSFHLSIGISTHYVINPSVLTH